MKFKAEKKQTQTGNFADKTLEESGKFFKIDLVPKEKTNRNSNRSLNSANAQKACNVHLQTCQKAPEGLFSSTFEPG